jgi:hypothetical protein
VSDGYSLRKHARDARLLHRIMRLRGVPWIIKMVLVLAPTDKDLGLQWIVAALA